MQPKQSTMRTGQIRSASLAIGMLTLLLPACSADTYPPVEILYADSGRIEKTDEGRLRLHNTNVIPLQVGARYGWRAYIRTNRERIKVTQEVTTARPTTREGSKDLRVSANGRTVTTSHDVDGASGFVYGIWSITAEDPAGPVQIRIIIEDQVERRFDFVLKKP